MTAQRHGRLLLLAPVIPAPCGNGLAMRTGFFLDAYSRYFDIDLAVFPIIAAPERVTDFARARVARMEVFPRPAVDTHFSLVVAISDAADRLSAFRRYGHPSLASRAAAAASHALAQWAGGIRYEVLHVERLYLAPLAQGWTSRQPAVRPRLLIDCDDDDALTYRRLATIESRYNRPQAAAWARAEADAFTSMAKQILPKFDLAFAASNTGAASLSAHAIQVSVVPNVASTKAIPLLRRQHRGRQTILFVATMGYAANDDAARWLLTRIWPRLRRAVRNPLRLILVGSNPSPSLAQLGRQHDVLITGTVADVAPYYRDADLAVIPVRAGGGTRIKLLEAAAHQVPIVSTTVGAEGTTFRHDRELLLADTEEGFAYACAALLQHRNRASRLAKQARARVARDYDPRRWAQHVGDLASHGFAQ